MKATDLFITASEVADLLGVSSVTAYRIIKTMNEELSSKGYLTIRGKVSRTYFLEKIYGGGALHGSAENRDS